jgi:hypothetical protein
MTRRQPMPACPLRLDEPCTLCHPDAMLGPQDCPTVGLVMSDPVLRAELAERRSHAQRGAAPVR